MATTIVNLKLDDFRGRRLDLLGRAQGISSSTAPGTTVPIYTTRGERTYIPFVTVEISDSLPLASACIWSLGVNGDNSWNTIDLHGAPWDVAANLPIILAPLPFSAGQAFVVSTPVYNRGMLFTTKMVTGGVVGKTLTFSAYGWSAST